MGTYCVACASLLQALLPVCDVPRSGKQGMKPVSALPRCVARCAALPADLPVPNCSPCPQTLVGVAIQGMPFEGGVLSLTGPVSLYA